MYKKSVILKSAMDKKGVILKRAMELAKKQKEISILDLLAELFLHDSG